MRMLRAEYLGAYCLLDGLIEREKLLGGWRFVELCLDATRMGMQTSLYEGGGKTIVGS